MLHTRLGRPSLLALPPLQFLNGCLPARRPIPNGPIFVPHDSSATETQVYVLETVLGVHKNDYQTQNEPRGF